MDSTPKGKGISGKRAGSGSGNRLSKKYKARTPKSESYTEFKKAPNNSFTFYHLHNHELTSEDRPSCLLIRGNGYFERAISDPMFKRNSNPIYQQFVDNMAPYPLVVNPVDKNGNYVMRPNTNRKNKEDPESFKEKVIVVECDAASTWTTDFKDFFETTLKPNVEVLHKTPIFRTKPVVVMSDPPCHDVQYWANMMETSAIIDIVDTFYVKGEDSDFVTVEEFLKASKDNLYSLWAPGKVPVEDVIHTYNLADDHLDDLDKKRYSDFLAEVEAQANEPEE